MIQPTPPSILTSESMPLRVLFYCRMCPSDEVWLSRRFRNWPVCVWLGFAFFRFPRLAWSCVSYRKTDSPIPTYEKRTTVHYSTWRILLLFASKHMCNNYWFSRVFLFPGKVYGFLNMCIGNERCRLPYRCWSICNIYILYHTSTLCPREK